jgi:hypothetical protein
MVTNANTAAIIGSLDGYIWHQKALNIIESGRPKSVASRRQKGRRPGWRMGLSARALRAPTRAPRLVLRATVRHTTGDYTDARSQLCDLTAHLIRLEPS